MLTTLRVSLCKARCLHIRFLYTGKKELSPLVAYQKKVDDNELRFDQHQHHLMLQLDQLWYQLQNYEPSSNAQSSLNRLKKTNDHSKNDVLSTVVQDILSETWLLCFDEFQVTDIGDAMIIRRLFEHLFANGMVMVSTSNRRPDDLYYNGLNRELFLPFIPFLKKHCQIYDMGSTLDYRLTGTDGQVQTVFDARKPSTEREINLLCEKLIAPHTPQPQELDVMGRKCYIPWQARGVVKFTFQELCTKNLFSADFIAIASTYHTLVLLNIPKLNIEHRDQIRRFIILIDELYNYYTKLICSILVDDVREIFTPLKDNKNLKREDLMSMDEFHAFDRTVSRLIEMQSKEYLAKPKLFSKKVQDEWSKL
ncbi:unnamed protein product [Didymodactylos carnosus]|uniref:AFG1-like ATPase n=1 Tax=Didymodactylos carnosus TaxID=1234261 RepID=A0A813RJJ5_9BILA|nr:unnamed protein product [Didymodactylos carnosus]CAF0863879.1 unnamed protein product [Didymodactylos carnosus]CAF3565176.1 unnamed protein product [Didymodactylos carnosus]CAF3648624.1 unnamed protein product [Didymodactylos carnosus]